MPAKIAVCLSFDFDGFSVWISNFRTESPNALSRGEFGRVGVGRILDLLGERALPATFFIPGHTVEAFPDTCARIAEAGHEIGHHGYLHENPRRLEDEGERRVLERGIELIEGIAGAPPRGYRAPAGSFSTRTLELLVEYGFHYDSSLMADDFTPYYPRSGDRAPNDGPFEYGKTLDLVELPFSWNLDDFPFFEYTATRMGVSPGLADPDRVYSVWSGEFDFLYQRLGAGVYTLTMHPQVIGRGHRMLMLERLLDYIAGHEGVEFTTMDAFAGTWREANVFPGPDAVLPR